jgi:hypothetical protein
MPTPGSRPTIPVLEAPANVAVNSRKGTPLWALDRYRTDALSSLIRDLKRLGRAKFGDDKGGACDQLKASLRSAVEYVQNAKGMINPLLFAELDQFAQEYKGWNDHHPDLTEERLVKLERLRYRICTIVKKNKKPLASDVRPEAANALFSGLRELVRTNGEFFPALRSALNRVSKQLPG